MKQHLLRSSLVLTAALLILVSLPVRVWADSPAFSDEQRKAFQSGARYFNTAEDVDCSALGGTEASPAQAGPVYFVGDSIGTQVQAGISAGLASGGWTFKANALSARQLTGGLPKPDGFGAVDQDLPSFANDPANANKSLRVVVELGTNSGGFSAATVGQMITKIRGIAPNSTIYWVDTATVQRQDLKATLDSVNSIIQTQAKQNNFQVISWNKAVFGGSADPTNMNVNAPDNGYIRRADQFVHLTDQGIKAMTDLIVKSVTNGTSSNSNSSGGCVCSGSSNLVGSENIEKIFNFLVGKGLTANQAAGFMGNIQAESGFRPNLVQYGGTNSRGEKSVAGQPSSLDDTMRIDGTTGYGLAQWTSKNRQQNLHDFAAQRGTKDGDLATQLDFLWQELTTSYGGVYNKLKQSTTLQDATFIILIEFERPRDIEGNKPVRLRFATAILAKYGSQTTPSADGTGTITGC